MHWKKQLKLNSNEYDYCAIADVVKEYNGNLAALPYSIRVLLESVARHLGEDVTEENIDTLVNWNPATPQGVVPFKPARVVLQDFTGVPAVVDLAAMRDAIVSLGGNASDINPEIPVTLVVDHSVQVDASGRPEAIAINTEREFERNQERYQFLKWAQRSFNDF